MNGLLLSKLFFETYWEEMEQTIKNRYKTSTAYGLVGEGSECFGFDDHTSRDHHWGAGLCIWLEEDAAEDALKALADYYIHLPDTFHGYPIKKPIGAMSRRLGAMKKPTFLYHLTGSAQRPQTWQDWLKIPEYALATVVNGSVFRDHDGVMTDLRNHFYQYYPEDVRRKKAAEWAMIMGQAGQYNFPRAVQRNDLVTAQYTLSLFMEAATGIIHVLNRRFMPYYKWRNRSLETLPILGMETSQDLLKLAEAARSREAMNESIALIESLSWKVILELENQGYTQDFKDFLFDQGPIINRSIQDEDLRNRPLLLSP